MSYKYILNIIYPCLPRKIGNPIVTPHSEPMRTSPLRSSSCGRFWVVPGPKFEVMFRVAVFLFSKDLESWSVSRKHVFCWFFVFFSLHRIVSPDILQIQGFRGLPILSSPSKQLLVSSPWQAAIENPLKGRCWYVSLWIPKSQISSAKLLTKSQSWYIMIYHLFAIPNVSFQKKNWWFPS